MLPDWLSEHHYQLFPSEGLRGAEQTQYNALAPPHWSLLEGGAWVRLLEMVVGALSMARRALLLPGAPKGRAVHDQH
jgi:hypothetical protein